MDTIGLDHLSKDKINLIKHSTKPQATIVLETGNTIAEAQSIRISDSRSGLHVNTMC